jgi:hypothetical protein
MNALTPEPSQPPSAIGNVSFLLESNMNAGRTKILRRSGSFEVMAVSASLLVVMYLLGRIGAPAAAEMYTKVGTCSLEDSCASAMAAIQTGQPRSYSDIDRDMHVPESLFMSS